MYTRLNVLWKMNHFHRLNYFLGKGKTIEQTNEFATHFNRVSFVILESQIIKSSTFIGGNIKFISENVKEISL
jgi:hypothetical protein